MFTAGSREAFDSYMFSRPSQCVFDVCLQMQASRRDELQNMLGRALAMRYPGRQYYKRQVFEEGDQCLYVNATM